MNDSQKRSVLVGLLDIHRRMAELEAMMTLSTIESPFSQFVHDLSPTESRVVRDYFARIRTTMLACLHDAGIPLERCRTSMRWSLQVGITFLSIALAEMAPERLRGYGALDAAGEANLVKIQQEIQRLIDRLGAYLRQGLGRDLSERLARLEASRVDAATLTLLDRIITRWQLVEFRPLLEAILRRLEAPEFEIAVFGRVSSGKSSLLNHIAGMDVLPVGVTPITTVPARLVRGEEAAAVIAFAEIEPRRIDVKQLRDFASEEGNPGNHKHVTNILVHLPAPRLREGMVLVDTPGIGALARAGSAETLAYLPRCDLGVVLIDAASALNQDDLGLLRALSEAGIPAQVLVSKADLLSLGDRERLVGYLREQLRQELGLDLSVHPVSTVGPHEALLTRWFEQEIEPLCDRRRALTEASLRRKIAHLRESVAAVLETLLARQRGGQDGRAGVDVGAAQRLLDAADAAVRQAKGRLLDWTREEPALVEVILGEAARAAAAQPGVGAETREDPAYRVLWEVLTERSRMAYQLVRQLQETLSQTLEALRQTAPLADADPAAIRGLAFRGLPAPDPSSLREKCRLSRPRWGWLLPWAVVWSARRVLEKQLAAELREYVGLYDRQLHAWLKAAVGQLLDLYESQAEVFREQVRRLTAETAGTETTSDVESLAADLEELQQASNGVAPEDSTVASAR